MIVDPGVCFVCGKNNPEGLQLDFDIDVEAKSLRAAWTPEARFQSFPGVTHGGILASLLDEAVGKLCFVSGRMSVTAEMSVRYLAPVPIGRPVTVSGRITEERGRVIRGESVILLEDGRTAARAEVTMIRGKE